MTAPSPRSPRPHRTTDRLAALARRLTDRDRRVCRLLWEHRVLTTQQLTSLCFPSRHAATHRLLQLQRLDVVDRFRPFRPTGSAPFHYVLGTMGAHILAAEQATTPSELGYSRGQTLAIAHSQRLGHLVGVNSFFAALAATASRRIDAALTAWWSERRCAQRWGHLVRPDGYGRWTEAGTTVEFFLEYDTGTETITRVANKLTGYTDLATASGIQTPLLLVVPSSRREVEVRRAIGTVPIPVATASSPIADPAAQVWLPTEVRERVRLAALGTAVTNTGLPADLPPQV
jgi:hypothetical protein